MVQLMQEAQAMFLPLLLRIVLPVLGGSFEFAALVVFSAFSVKTTTSRLIDTIIKDKDNYSADLEFREVCSKPNF